ncbi:hypothetical protein CC86DRAFT_391080 [Ophiobolus disseminans]|uniref:FAD/NAD(P)-binding domain-containing protein n=1 Tax=Ophiobolus disseminans TaxID=1469910 RepID=A0A6A7ADY1_9PLEO|nr:hypothetical protein CC86DRAFT_391080 [Ophiobolus disseminans]
MPCVTYSMSFDPAVTYHQWFPLQSEILRFHDVASKHDLNKHIRLNSKMDTGSNETFELDTKILVFTIGQLVEPSYGGIQGRTLFDGDVLHCNRWKNDVILDQKHIVVIVNGASAAQIIPSIIHKVRSLTQLIRSPQGYNKQKNYTLSPLTRWMFKYIPLHLKAWRYCNFLTLESRFPQFWNTSQGEKMRQRNMQLCHEYTKASAPKKYWDLLLSDYQAGCKRLIGDFSYLASLNSPNLKLVCDRVVQCDEAGVLTQSGQHYNADVIVNLRNWLPMQWHHLDVRGRNGASLSENWADGKTDHYQTTSISGFPNFFMLYGPNSAPLNMSAIYCFENYVDLILKVVEPVLDDKANSVEVDAHAEKAFMSDLRIALDGDVWESCEQRTWDPMENERMYPWSNTTMFKNTHQKDQKAWIYRDGNGGEL